MYYFTYLASEPSADIFRVRKAGFPKETGTQPTAGCPYCHAIVGLVSSTTDVTIFTQKLSLSGTLLLDSLFISRLILIKPWLPKKQKKRLGETVLTLKDLPQCALCIFFLANIERFAAMRVMKFFLFKLTTGRPQGRPWPTPCFVHTGSL